MCSSIVFLILVNNLAASAQDLFWENFDLPSGTTQDNGPTAWSRDMSNTNLGTSGYFETRVNENGSSFHGHNLGGEGVWLSQTIDISSLSSVLASIDIGEFGTLEGNDYIRLYYRLDGGPEVIFGDFRNDFGSTLQTIYSPELSGASLQIIVRVSNNSLFEVHIFDNIRVFDSSQGGVTLFSRGSRNWNNRNAWSLTAVDGPSCGCTPDANSNVVIGGNHAIKLNSDGSARSIIIQNNGSLYSNNQSGLSISGDFVVSSTHSDPIDLGQQTITFDGSIDQNVSVAGESLYNIIINKSGGRVILTTALDLEDQLMIQSVSELVSNGHLKIISTSDNSFGNGMIGEIPNGATVSGDVTVQRYISGEGNVWRYLSTPVTNATIADWQDDFPITGTFSDPSSGPGVNSSQPSLYVYGESGSGVDLSLGWIAYPSSGSAASNPIAPGAGYSALMLNGANPTLVEVTGPINQGNFNFNVSYAGSGWNLLGNPYPATIDWSNSSGRSSSNVANAIYIRNNENGNQNSTVASFVDGVGTNGGTGLIATGQAFWVQAIGATPSLEINERAKSTSTGVFFKKQNPDNLLRITLSNAKEKDEAVVRFSKQATLGYDPEKDAKKFNNGGINISTLVESETAMAINTMPELQCAQQLQLKLSKTKPGNYSMTFTEFTRFNLPYKITLFDNYLDSTLTIMDSTSYDFAVDQNLDSFKERFELSFEPMQVSYAQFQVNGLCDGTAELSWQNTSSTMVYALYQNDSLISWSNGNGSTVSITIPSDLRTTSNSLFVRLESTVCGKVVFEQMLDLPSSLLPQIQSVTSGHNCTIGPVTLRAEATNSLNTPLHFNWYDQLTSEVPVAITNIGTYNTPKLASTKTYYVSVTSPLGCESDRVAIVADIIGLDPPQISRTESNLLESNHTHGNQWYYNGQVLPNSHGKTHQALHPGIYGLEVTTSKCSFYEEIEMAPSDFIPDSEMFVVYPNPVIDRAEISFNTLTDETVNVSVFDVYGKIRLKTSMQISNHGGQVDLSKLAPGIYYLEIVDHLKRFSTKVIKSAY